MTSIRVSLTILCALNLAFVPSVAAQDSCAMCTSFNVAVGFGALTTGDRNVAIGVDALGGNTTGRLNTALGFAALPVITTGSNNIAIGSEAEN
jgi:hypothetical protein